jgi:TRAP-type C4-dicarboxylate transport system substrate-binding protein
MSCPRHLLGPATVFATVLIVSAGCSGGQVNKAGGSAPAKPLVLTLAAHADDDNAYRPFVAAVARLSGGSLRVKVLGDWRTTNTSSEIRYERGMIEDVRAGKAQLGIFGARVWDTLNVTAFQALLAPFLVDSLALELRALQTPFATRALASVREAGVVGIALLPGRLRRPLGLTRSLLGPEDYRGARIATRPSVLAEDTFRALGAHPDGFIPGQVIGFDGTDIDPFTATANAIEQGARALTANVVLWPKVWTIVMNRAAFARLTHAQQRILLAAGRAARGPDRALAAHDQRLAISILCSEKFPLVAATAADAAALRKAVQPVYDRIERNPFTKQWITQIQRMRATTAPDVARCPD